LLLDIRFGGGAFHPGFLAQDIYLYCVNHEPANPDYQARLAFCYYQHKKFAKAAQAYQKSVTLDSTQPTRYYNLGLALKAAGRPAEADRAIHKALELEPKSGEIHYYLGVVYGYLNQYELADKEFKISRELGYKP